MPNIGIDISVSASILGLDITCLTWLSLSISCINCNRSPAWFERVLFLVYYMRDIEVHPNVKGFSRQDLHLAYWGIYIPAGYVTWVAMIRRTIPCYYLDDIGTTEGPLMFVEVSRVSPTQVPFGHGKLRIPVWNKNNKLRVGSLFIYLFGGGMENKWAHLGSTPGYSHFRSKINASRRRKSQSARP